MLDPGLIVIVLALGGAAWLIALFSAVLEKEWKLVKTLLAIGILVFTLGICACFGVTAHLV